MAKPKFYQALSKRAFLINQTGAGAGITGVVGFLILFVISSFFFVTENYFLSLGIISIALMMYVSGSDVYKIFMSAATIFFSSKHLIKKASEVQDTMVALTELLNIRRNPKGEIVSDPIAVNAKIVLPENDFVRDLQKLIDSDKKEKYAEFLSHAYYEDCNDLYERSNDNFNFVSECMPLFGLIGTVLGLIQMFDTLGADVSVEALSPQLALALKTTLYGAIFSSLYRIVAARFEQRLKSLQNDYGALEIAIKVLLENKVKIEVEK
jgi:flagellar motor component MotA